ncbi:hypothetical protein [Chamaesiphon sp. GL140_3_metabinner_50]|uniref:hypothetical protein n=1 Tax=Chamaesiphon sp. GL140_3_metabinner_50 TaxID=2970812 RepID=UPI0025E84714|nr:hypothetical protein [Chamaesiphon sp. GL140_3_metabinner_50]
MNNLPQKLSDNLASSILLRSGLSANDPEQKIVKPQRNSAQELHKYVLGLIGVFVLIVISYPIAMNQVAQKEKFAPSKSHLKSLTLEYKQIEPQSENSIAITDPAQTPDLIANAPADTLTKTSLVPVKTSRSRFGRHIRAR